MGIAKFTEIVIYYSIIVFYGPKIKKLEDSFTTSKFQ